MLDHQLVKIDDYTVCGRISKDFYDDVLKQSNAITTQVDQLIASQG